MLPLLQALPNQRQVLLNQLPAQLKSNFELIFKIIFTICSSVFLIFAFRASGFADEHFPFLAEVTKESVNVRAGPSTNFEKVDKLKVGDQVVVIGRSYEWLKVQPLATTREYIRSDYLKLKDKTDVAQVTGDNVNVRASANSNAATLGQVKEGAVVEVINQVADPTAGKMGWTSIKPVMGSAVWIHQDFLMKTSDQVPQALLIKPVDMTQVKPVVVQSSSSVVVEPVVKVITSSVSLQGVLEPLAQAPRSDVHYEIVIDNKSVYYLQDMPHLDSFANVVVDVEGSIVPDWQKKSMYPLVHVSKIVLVL